MVFYWILTLITLGLWLVRRYLRLASKSKYLRCVSLTVISTTVVWLLCSVGLLQLRAYHSHQFSYYAELHAALSTFSDIDVNTRYAILKYNDAVAKERAGQSDYYTHVLYPRDVDWYTLPYITW